jgi:hypothetical protein
MPWIGIINTIRDGNLITAWACGLERRRSPEWARYLEGGDSSPSKVGKAADGDLPPPCHCRYLKLILRHQRN